jgi:hypothetical protein
MMAAACQILHDWIGGAGVHRIAVENGWALLRGEDVETPDPLPPPQKRNWLARLWG